MIPDESPRGGPETEALSALLGLTNDNGSDADVAIDPRIQIIARSIGRQIARERLDCMRANDNRPNDEQ